MSVMKLKSLLFYAVFLLSAAVFGQDTYTLTGTVYNAQDNQTLPGANVSALGTQKAVSTDLDGNFSISVEGTETLQISYMGMETVVVILNGEKELSVTLKQASTELDEVVVVGYGTQKKSSVTGSVSKLENENLDEVTSSRVDKSLQGRIAGLQIQNITSEVGEDPQIRIRGLGSISASSNPLIVVDGFPIENGLEFINPSTIESIEVLKDAASTAIYGSRGANGVILVTTKEGSPTKTTYEFKSYFGVKDAYRDMDLLDIYEYTDMLRSERQQSENYAAGVEGRDPNTIDFTPREKGMREVARNVGDIDWQQEGQRHPELIKNYQLNVSGGSDNTTYYIAGQYIDDEGLLRDNFLNRINFQSRVKTKLTKNLTLDVNLRPSYTKRRRSSVAFTDYARTYTFLPVRHNEYTSALTGYPVGSYAHGRHFNDLHFMYTDENGVEQDFTTSLWGTNNNNPVARMDSDRRFQHDYRMLSNFALDWRITKKLRFRTSGGVNIDYSNYERFRSSEAEFTGQAIGEDNSTMKVRFLTENTLTYNWTRGDHEADILGGITYQKTKYKFINMYGTQFPSDYIETLNAANLIDASESFTRKEATNLLSFLARVNYGYKNKYLVSLAIRTDGSSVFGPENRYGWFPSVSAGWNISEEPFWKDNVKFINRFKIRSSFGITGNNNIDNYAFTNLLYTHNYSLGTGTGSVTSGLGETGAVLGNPAISWEQTYEYDTGTDIGFWGNKLNLTLDYYYSITDKLLLQQNVSYVTGHQQYFNNIGKIENKGIEVEVSANIKAGKFTWKPSFNLAANKNRLVSLGGEAQFISQGERNEQYIARVGDKAIQFYGYKMIGVWQSADELANNPHSSDDAVGGIRVADLNGDGTITADDRTTLGSPFPDFTWGFYNSFTYGNFDMNFLVQGSVGGEVFYGDGYYNEIRYLSRDFTEGRWFNEGVPATKPRENIGRAWQNTDYLIRDASYVSLRAVTLGYQLPVDITQKFGLSKARFYLTGENLLYVMADNYPGLNPEALNTNGAYASPLVSGYQRGAYPTQRTIAFGIDINF